MCAGCRRRAPQGELTRLVRGPGGRAELDGTPRAPGRGAYVCSADCLDRAARRGGLARAFRAPVSATPGADALRAPNAH